MQIEFVNQASYIIKWGENKNQLITDPWFDGSAFNCGWKHLSKSGFKYKDFKKYYSLVKI